jgi:hypothetical protein
VPTRLLIKLGLRLLAWAAFASIAAFTAARVLGEPQPPPHRIFLPALFSNYTPPAFTGPEIPFGYGWGVYDWRAYWSSRAPADPTSFNWLRVSENPEPQYLCGPNFRLRENVLLRLNKADANATVQQVADDTFTWAQALKATAQHARCVEAFEIGNEPNLSMTGAYGGPVNPEQYADQLCAAYDAIKKTDPNFIVVSGGLAPTAGLTDPTQALTDTVFLRRMLARIQQTRSGAANACFDVLGYHNYGFRAGYATDPASPACVDRSCFRGVEDIYRIMREEYGVTRRIWATEVGWLRDFTAGGCGGAPWAWSFGGWQRSDADQANQLVNAFQYARAYWPWLGAMFVFNSDYNERPLDICHDEQGWFAVKGHAAEVALEAMPKP